MNGDILKIHRLPLLKDANVDQGAGKINDRQNENRGRRSSRWPRISYSTGAGEAIRTPDPHLGKVMLYP